MKNIFLLVYLLVTSSIVFAQQKSAGISYSMPAIEVGFKWNTATVASTISDKQEVGFQLGASVVFNFLEDFGLRSGMFYSERPFKSEFANGTSSKGKITYFEIPAQMMFKFEDFAGVYIGPSMAVKLGDEATAGTLTNIKGFIMPITFGAQFKFISSFGTNIFFEVVPGDLAANVSNSRAVGVNLLFTLD